MFQLQCNIYQLNYETAFSFLIQKITPHTDMILQPFLKSISLCTKEITQAVITTTSQKDIQNAIVYFVNEYHNKLSRSIEKTFLKKGFTIEVNSLNVTLEQETQEFLFYMEFQIISYPIKILTPILSDKFFSHLFHIKHFTEALLLLAENIFQTQCNFAKIKNLHIEVI